MKRMALSKAALSSLIVATTMVGCSGAAFRPKVAVVEQKGSATKLTAMAEKALAAHDAVRAIESAEAAVKLSPQDAASRALLGRAYIAAGRFASAETALTDAMTLGDTSPRTTIGLALVRVAQGKAGEAQQLLVANRETIPAADYGLAIAMAGDAPEGVRLLTEAAQGNSDARTRQNLAYAYALAGRWKDARVMAGQDLAPLEANKRIASWAVMADPAMAPQRIASLMGTTIAAEDFGLPAALALAPNEGAPALAEAAPVEAAPVEAVPVQFAEATPADPLVVETATSVEAPIIQAPETPVRVAAVPAAKDFVVEQRGAKPTRAKAAPAAAAPVKDARMQQVAFIKPVENGASNWVVQLGAYDTAAIAKEKWTNMARGNATLAAFPVLTSQVTVKGKAFHRLAINGFANRADAMKLCATVKAQRGQCFVREGAAGATPQRWAVASQKGRQYASR
jgi:Flp pilus assembly protein TadD